MNERATKLQPRKVEAVAKLKEGFEGRQDFIFTDYRGLTVSQITELRHRLRTERSVYKVVKNGFANIVFRDLKLPDVSAFLTGPTAIALPDNDPAAAAKILFEYAKETSVRVKGGLIGGRVYNLPQVEALSKLPSLPVLIAMLMGTMNAPIQRLVYGLNGVTTQLVRTLQAVADSKRA